MILNAISEKLKRQSKVDFKGPHFEAWLVVQAVTWYLRYPVSYRDLEEMFRERGFEIDHSTINRCVLTYAPMIEKRLRQFRQPQCGSVRIDETYVTIRGKWRYLYRAINKHGNPVDFLLMAKHSRRFEVPERRDASGVVVDGGPAGNLIFEASLWDNGAAMSVCLQLSYRFGRISNSKFRDSKRMVASFDKRPFSVHR